MKPGWLPLVLLLLSGCGYHLIGAEPQLPEDIRSLAVGDIANHTREHGLEKTLEFAFEREIHIRQQYRLEQNSARADAILTGLIRRLDRRPVAFDESDQAVIYELTLSVDLTLTRRDDGKTIWRVRNLKKLDEYASNPRMVVTSSSEFQQGTLNPSDLPKNNDSIPDHEQISLIQLADSERQRAVNRLVATAVHDAYESMIEGF